MLLWLIHTKLKFPSEAGLQGLNRYTQCMFLYRIQNQPNDFLFRESRQPNHAHTSFWAGLVPEIKTIDEKWSPSKDSAMTKQRQRRRRCIQLHPFVPNPYRNPIMAAIIIDKFMVWRLQASVATHVRDFNAAAAAPIGGPVKRVKISCAS